MCCWKARRKDKSGWTFKNLSCDLSKRAINIIKGSQKIKQNEDRIDTLEFGYAQIVSNLGGSVFV